MRRSIVPLMFVAALAMAAPANAQTLGTFRWNTAPFCNVLNVTVIQQGAVFQLIGFEEQCGGNPSLPVFGTALIQTDGSIWVGWTTVMEDGRGLVTRATLSTPDFNGTWSDNSGESGTMTFNPGPVESLPGGPRPGPVP